MNVKHLKEYKDSCYSALSRDLTEFEKNFLLVAGAILAFSITFIKDIIKISEAQYLFLLFVGWGFIIISIGLMMHAFLKSANDSEELWKIADDYIIENNFFNDEKTLNDDECKDIKGKINTILSPSKKNLKNIRKDAVLCFLIGVVSFSIFVGINLLRENNLNLKSSESNPIKKVSINDTIILQNQKP